MRHLNKHHRTTVSRALLCFALIAILGQVSGQQEFSQEQQQQQPTAANETGYLSGRHFLFSNFHFFIQHF